MLPGPIATRCKIGDLFATLMLVPRIAGNANATTALGPRWFFRARLIDLPVFVTGIPRVRTAL